MIDNNTANSLDILHHLGVINTDLDYLSQCYERLGFSLTPTSMPAIVMNPNGVPETLGVGNRHAIFKNNYLELLGIVDPQRWAGIPKDKLGPYNIDKPLASYEGLHVMHFGTQHIESVRQRLLDQGILCSDIKNFQRDIKTPNGDQTMRARSLYLPAEFTTEGLLQIAQHDTPELVFQPQYMVHKNGATAISEIIVCVDNPLDYATKYEKITKHKIEATSQDHYKVDLGDSKIIVTTIVGLKEIIPGFTPPVLPFMAGFTVQTFSLQMARTVLIRNGIPFYENKDTIVVNPVYGGGSAVIFKEDIIIED